MKKEIKIIKTDSEKQCLSPEQFWNGYRALINVLVHHYKEEI